MNSRLIYLNVSAYTSLGPRANEIGFDGIGQVMSGAAYMSGFGEQPTREARADEAGEAGQEGGRHGEISDERGPLPSALPERSAAKPRGV